MVTPSVGLTSDFVPFLRSTTELCKYSAIKAHPN